MSELVDRGYAYPGALVSTDWVVRHLDDPNVRIIESNESPLVYPSGHIPGAVEVDWIRDLNDPINRDYLDRGDFSALMQRLGVTEKTTLVFYGDKSNWWACYAFWVFQLFGHTNSRVMDGGRLKWEFEGRELTIQEPRIAASNYQSAERNDERIRIFRQQVMDHLLAGGRLVDVRSPAEFHGELLHMSDYPNEGAVRGGHIPTANNIPWAEAVHPHDGTFRPAAELRRLYLQEHDLKADDDVVVYCRIGERSSHTWFVLRYLLGFGKVRNYDGSWVEWGNLVGVPIER